MSFQCLPPEVTSAQMYTGAGSGPMLSAAAGWAGLGSELGSAAESFSSLTSALTGGGWQGAASQAMSNVASQYVQWLSGAAAHAGTAAAQANAVAGIFEAAKAAVAHPLAVAANRVQMVNLVRSNLFGFNAPAIAATEGAYEGMWAQNVASLAGYHGAASAVAAQLTPLQQALQPLGATPTHAAQAATPAASVSLIQELESLAASNQANIFALQATNKAELALISGNVQAFYSAALSMGVSDIRTSARELAGGTVYGIGAISGLIGLNVGTVIELPSEDIASFGLDWTIGDITLF